MSQFRKKIYAAAGYNTIYFGSGRKEFDPNKPMPPFENYIKEAAQGTCKQLAHVEIDEGIIGSFMSGRFLKQANLPGFLPFIIPSLRYKPCTGVEGACGTGGRAIAMAMRSVLADFAETVFVVGFEMQNTMKAVYGSDVLAGASYYNKERKKGGAFFFPELFSDRAGAYYNLYGYDRTRQAMAKWYEQSILNARKNPKAQEFSNSAKNLYELGMTPPNPEQFVTYLNAYDCSKVTDGASSLLVLTDEGMKKCGLSKKDVVEIIAIGEAEEDITEAPHNLTELSTTAKAVEMALNNAGITKEDIAVLEIHDCFSITALLALEAIGFAKKGKGPDFILEEKSSKAGMIPTNLSGGLGGFGHPTGATGVRQMVDLLDQLTQKAANQTVLTKPYGMMISMGGNDKTVTCIIVKKSND